MHLMFKNMLGNTDMDEGQKKEMEKIWQKSIKKSKHKRRPSSGEAQA